MQNGATLSCLHWILTLTLQWRSRNRGVNQFGHFPLTSIKHSLPEKRKMSVDEQFLKNRWANLAPPTILSLKSLNHLFDAQFEIQQVILTKFTCLNALRHGHVLGWLDSSVEWMCVPNKVASECIPRMRLLQRFGCDIFHPLILLLQKEYSRSLMLMRFHGLLKVNVSNG